MNTERELIAKAAAGDTEAFEQLILTYQKPVYNLALRLSGNPDDAFDLSQEAFLRAWRGLGALRSDAAFSTWIYRLTSNVCIDFLRAAKRKKTVSLTFAEDSEAQQLEIPDPAPDPEQCAIRADDREKLRRAMDELDVEYRQILTLRVIDGLSYIAIAQILGVAEGTVKSRLFRARESLRKKLAADGNRGAGSASEKKGRRGRHGL